MGLNNLPIKKIDLTKIPFKNLVIVCLATVCLFSINKCTVNEIQLDRVNQDWSFKLSAKEKEFTKKVLSDSSVIATQKQNLTALEDKQLKLLSEAEGLKKLKSVVRTTTVTQIERVFIAFTDTIIVNENNEAIDSLKHFEVNNEWYAFSGLVYPNGLMVDSISIKNRFSVAMGYEKPSGVLRSFKKKNPVVKIKSENPYTDIQTMENIVVKEKKRFYQTTGFKVGVGLIGGFLIAR